MTDSPSLQTPGKLDEITERVMQEFARTQFELRANPYGSSLEVLKEAAISARLALRERIRQLIEEARSKAVVDYLADKTFVIGDMSGVDVVDDPPSPKRICMAQGCDKPREPGSIFCKADQVEGP